MSNNTQNDIDGSFLLPDANDKLFNEFNDDFRHNAMISTGISKFFLFSDSYRTAALSLFEKLDGSAYLANTLVYPLVFLNRHFLELRLKELVSGLNYAVKQEYKFSTGHKLRELWNEYKSLLPQAGESFSPEKQTLLSVEKLILEFDSIDPGSFSFRYPVNTLSNPSLKMTNLDLENFRLTMIKLYNFFETQSDVVFHLIDIADEFYSEMRRQYDRDMFSYY
jgi:hypothetical protein